ncbi:MAG TPA: organomercurial lyase [Gaiellaceae bacterium]|nr:organomercurial lyase [Gaiellaceae bacterium]
MTGLDDRVRLAIYQAFIAGGRPPTVPEAAGAVDAAEEDVADAYDRLARDRVIVLAPDTGYVWMAAPFSAMPTRFRVETARGAWFGNCIWDALGIPAMLGDDGVVSTTCPDCGDPFEARVSGGELADDGFVAHFAVPAARWWDDIGYT